MTYCTAPDREFASVMREQTGNSLLSPGDFVRHPGRPDWGLGQVQSVDGHRVTVNFDEVGKQTIDIHQIGLEYAGPDPREDSRLS